MEKRLTWPREREPGGVRMTPWEAYIRPHALHSVCGPAGPRRISGVSASPTPQLTHLPPPSPPSASLLLVRPPLEKGDASREGASLRGFCSCGVRENPQGDSRCNSRLLAT